jgi:hypothetical protein
MTVRSRGNERFGIRMTDPVVVPATDNQGGEEQEPRLVVGSIAGSLHGSGCKYLVPVPLIDLKLLKACGG